jgi:phage terminase small subunit
VPSISDKHSRFIDEYLIDLNASKAYQRVYVDASPESARRLGSQLLTNVDIREEIKERLKASREASEITRERVLREYKLIAFSNLCDFVLQNGEDITMRDLDSIDIENQRVLKEISITRSTNPSTEDIEVTTKIKLYDKIKALDKLSEYSKLMDSGDNDQGDIEWDNE